MNPETRKLLMEMKKRNEQRLSDLRRQVEDGTVRDADLSNVQDEIEKVTDELQDIADQLGEEEPADEPDPADDPEDRSGEDEPEPADDPKDEPEDRVLE